jgi:hypothetical protein
MVNIYGEHSPVGLTQTQLEQLERELACLYREMVRRVDGCEISIGLDGHLRVLEEGTYPLPTEDYRRLGNIRQLEIAQSRRDPKEWAKEIIETALAAGAIEKKGVAQ